MANEAWDYYKEFLHWNIEKQNEELLTRPPHFWEEMGQQKALAVFHEAAVRVPAYKKFLAENGIDHTAIKTFEQFQTVPPITKKNYLKVYPLHELCWDGNLKNKNVISVSSGSTGTPFFWPRDIQQEHEVDHWYELTLKYLFNADEKHSLIIIAFAMGMYIAGPFTYASCLRIAQKGYPITITTPSNDIAAVLRIVKYLGPEFDQVIIGGYPPLVKDIVDAGLADGIDWASKNTKLFFGGEGFSEKWRSYVHKRVGAQSDLNTTVNMYGTADAALVAIETPASIALRQGGSDDLAFREMVFGSERLPSVLTYNPLLRYFETDEERNLMFTSSSGIPLIRYKIGDVGGVIPYQDISKHLKSEVGDFSKILARQGLSKADWKLPLVYLFGRDDFTVHLYGANVYPENIKEALEDSLLHENVTGKFIITTEHKKDMTPYLSLRVELKKGIVASGELRGLVKKTVTKYLREKNSEYNVIYGTIKRKAEPKVKLEPYRSEDFQVNIKHRWVNKLADNKPS